MKYMGSKRAMLQNGLGELIREKSHSAKRIVDLFCGSAAVSWFAAENTSCSIFSVDLQAFSATLATAVICRTSPLDPAKLASLWMPPAMKMRSESLSWFKAFHLDRSDDPIEVIGKKARRLANQIDGPIMNAYGGYYFSPMQCLGLDALRRHLPEKEPARSACLAALIATASKCAAAPGHTAQPFTPSDTSESSIREAWKRDPFAIAYGELENICRRSARKKGVAIVGDAVQIAATLNSDDLVFVDPPYSGVQYSRFYHVLETLTHGIAVRVSGSGRYPALQDRPQSPFSNRGQSQQAVSSLIEALAQSKCTALFTFPNAECSNGLSAEIITSIAERFFNVKSKTVPTRFSTLGGNNLKRDARLKCEELILIMERKSDRRTLRTSAQSA